MDNHQMLQFRIIDTYLGEIKKMLDLKFIRENPKLVQKKALQKGCEIDVDKILDFDERARKLQTKAEDAKAKRNQTAKEIGEQKRSGKDISSLTKGLKVHSENITQLDGEIKDLLSKRDFMLATIPNMPADDVPVFDDPKDNKCIKEIGTKPTFSFKFKNHLEINETFRLFDFERGAKISGAGWPVYTNLGARLEWALINYMIETHVNNGFEQIIPPICVKPQTMYYSGQLPKFQNQFFEINDDDYDLNLVPTAEVALNAFYSEETFKSKEELPKYLAAYTPCFRREAGASGKNERGLIRTHQFNKVELFAFTTPDNSEKAFEKILLSAEEILKGLGLHYRNMLLCTGDMSFTAAKTVDIEVYLPGQNRYYEVSSVSNCTDFQARRSRTRFKDETKKAKFVHTLNGSGVATSRLMVAILENFQQEDGGIKIPKVLHKYLGDKTVAIFEKHDKPKQK
jgi:seryl-tRNA synthetase